MANQRPDEDCLTPDEVRMVLRIHHAGSYDVGDDGIAYVVVEGERVPSEEVEELVSAITDACRRALAELHQHASLRADLLGPEVLTVLADRGLISDHGIAGRIEATPAAAGYCADPSTFEV